jgi:hypothetical protein|tara:strand:- start:141 stop:1553 length:1413 start_codon:yes stop_codon:yes gene_type:complete
MALAQFKKLTKSNCRDTHKVPEEYAVYHTTNVKMIYPPSKYVGVHAPLDHNLLEKEFGLFEKAKVTAKSRGSRSVRKVFGAGIKDSSGTEAPIYVFQWAALPGSGINGKKYVNVESRKHLAKVIKRKKREPGEKTGKPLLEKQVGGHVEASAFMQILRKAVDFGVIDADEARRYLKAFREGNLSNMIETEGAFTQTNKKTGKVTKSRESYTENKGFINMEISEEAFGLEYNLIKKISEYDTDYNINKEVMMSIPEGLNKQQEEEYEEAAINALKKDMNNLADAKLVNDPTSPSLEKMYQEIIAAALLGKKVPKYNVDIGFKEKRGRTVTKKQIRSPKSKEKRAGSKGGKLKLQHQLRDAAGRFANPTSLVHLLNKKLTAKIKENMQEPGLVNRSGTFAESVRILKASQSKNAGMPILQYTYDRDPYGVFEVGAGDSRWATAARDPRVVIDKSIREVAIGIMQNRFATQRL